MNDKLSIQVGYLIRLLFQPIRLFIFEDYVMPCALVASLTLSNHGGTIELDERCGNLGSCHQQISYRFPDKEIDKRLIVKESHNLVGHSRIT